jgi:hypothetical protein
MPDVTFGGAFSFAARSLFARGPIRQMIRVIAVVSASSGSAHVERHMGRQKVIR